jgi:polar amino acid transport system substrate-binding protein
MRVGVIEQPPFASLANGKPSGVETQMVRALAEQMHSNVIWVPGSAPDLLDAVANDQLEIVIGGVSASTPWIKRVAITNGFYTDRLVVAAPPGAGTLRNLDNRRVAVKIGDAAAAYVRDQGGTPVFVRSLDQATGLVAAPEWQLPRLHRSSSGIVLRKLDHVWALPRGENGWLVQVEQFQRKWKPRIGPMLQTETVR